MASQSIKFDIMGGYSKAEYNELDPQETINSFLVSASGGKKAMFPQPGLSITAGIDFVASPNKVGRKTYIFNNAMFVNIGDDIYRCTPSSKGLSHTLIGSIGTSQGYVGRANTDDQLMFVDGVDGWIWDKTLLQKVTFGFDIKPIDVVVVGNRFLVLDGESKRWYYSSNGDGFTWNVLHFNSFQNGDICAAIAELAGRIYVMGQISTVIWRNFGAPIDPYRQSDPTIDMGCASAASVAKGFGMLVWLSKTDSGVGSIVATTGGIPLPISDQFIDTALSKIADVSDASGFIHKNEYGHIMYRICFTSANISFEYDFNTKLWNKPEHAKKKDPEGRHLSQDHSFFNSKHYVIDYSAPKLYEMSIKYFNDAGTAIRRARISSILEAPPDSVINLNSATFRLKQGIGGDCGVDENPLLYYQTSIDDGDSYGNQLTDEIGEIGRRTWETSFDRGVSGRSIVFKLEFYAARPLVITQADLNVEVGRVR